MANALNKDFKAAILKSASKVKKDVEKLKKMMYKWNININRVRKSKKKLKRNPEGQNIVTKI